MLYTKPATHEQQRYYARFAGVLAMHTWTRRFVQYLVWLPLATVALTAVIQQTVAKFINIPSPFIAAVCLLTVFFLHRLMAAGYKAHLFNRWDGDPDTNSSPWTIFLYIAIGCTLAALEWKTTASFFQSNIETPYTYDPYAESEPLRKGRHEYEKEQYDTQKTQIEENARQQEQMLAAPTLSEINRLQKTKAPTLDDRNWKRKRLADLQAKIDNDPRITTLRQATASRLDTLLLNYTNTIRTIENEYRQEITETQNENVAAALNYQNKLTAANRYAGLISIISLGIFLICGYWQVRIQTRSGIYPIRQFTDLEAHGGIFEKGTLAIGDVINRLLHQLFYAIHKSGSQSAGQLKGFDGKVFMQDGNYQQQHHAEKAKLNGHHHPTEPSGKT